MNDYLLDYIQKVRSNKAWYNLLYSSLFIFSIIILLFIILGFIEFIFHLTRENRIIIFQIIIFSCFSSIIYLFSNWFIQTKGLFGNYTDFEIASLIGDNKPEISDRLLNGIQLAQSKNDQNHDLINHAINKIKLQIEQIPYQNINFKHSNEWKYIFIFCLLFFIASWKLYSEAPENAYKRILNPTINYKIPKPFQLNSISKNQFVLGGDTTEFVLHGIGKLPDSINIFINNKEEIISKKISQLNGNYTYKICNIKKDLIVWGEFKNKLLFSAWEKIVSIPDTIFVQDRPIIENIEFIIFPPKYSKLDEFNHPGNITKISMLYGSKIKIKAKASKKIVSAYAKIGNKIKKLYTNQNKISGVLSIQKNDTLSIYCKDENNIQNNSPTHYNIQVFNDLPPDILVFEPQNTVELNESMNIPIKIMINDDYGISFMNIKYWIVHPEYLFEDTTNYIFQLNDFEKNLKSQNYSINWNIGFLNLMPEDKIFFQIGAGDNNAINGPSWTYTKKIQAFYPSLEDMFSQIENDENKILEETENITLTKDEIKELVQDLKLDLLKSEKMNWEQSQDTEEIIQKVKDVFEQMEQMSEALDAIKENIEKNDLFNENLTKKFQNLQELLNQLMTPEMKEALEKMRKAKEELDPEKMLQALEEFEFNSQNFEEELDRFIDMFELAVAEQKMDEISKKLEQMIKKQQTIIDDLNNKSIKSEELAAREKRQEQEMENLEETMIDAKALIEKFSPATSKKIDNLKNSDAKKQAESDIKDAQMNFSQNNKKQGGEKSKSAKTNLEEVSEQFKNMKQEFQNEMVKKMTKEFQRVVYNILSISKEQEKIYRSSKHLKSKSPKLMETAVIQNNIQRQMQKLLDQVMALSKKTFYITPEIGRILGRSIVNMNKSIAGFEQKQISSSRTQQLSAIESLNDAAYLLLNAMNQMNESGSASGMEQFFEQMSKMSEQQKGINQGTMQMGQMGMMAQKSMMQQLQQQQEALQKALNELLNNNPGKKGGGLEKAKQEIEEVIKDFKNRKINQQTIERQEKILSRMLDSQRSITQKDFSNKRESTKAENFLYLGPDGLPLNYGEHKLIIMEAMENALQEGYSTDYNKMIRKYFHSLQEANNEKTENAIP